MPSVSLWSNGNSSDCLTTSEFQRNTSADCAPLAAARSRARALYLAARKNEGLEKAEESPDGEKCQALERETLELEKQLGDHERNDERNRFLPGGSAKAEIPDE
jgi:hypothetical protein